MVTEIVADLVEGTGFEHEAVLAGLEAAGYKEKVRVGNDDDIWWDTTIQAMLWRGQASGSRSAEKTADRLVSGLLEGAQTYNAGPDKPLFINALRVFGSYLSPKIDPWVTSTSSSRMAEGSPTRRRCRGLHQSQRAVVQHVHGPAAVAADRTRPAPEEALSVHQYHACITMITDRSDTLYSIDADPQAVPAPADRTLIGR